MPSRLLAAAAFAAVLAGAPALAQIPIVPGEPALALKNEERARLRLPTSEGVRLELADASAQALGQVRAANARSGRFKEREQARRLVIGVHRATDGEHGAMRASGLRWIAVPGGHAAKVAVASPGAQALRLGFALLGVPEDVEMTFTGSADASRAEGPVRVGSIADRTSTWWSPVTQGEAQTVEVFVPSHIDPRRLPLRVAGVSHLVAMPSGTLSKRLQDIGRSGSCNVDLPCSSLNANQAFRDAAASVAQMVFTDGPYTALCTGSLLNDADPSSQVPYFFSANHCFENEAAPYKTAAQMQAVANTLTTLWGFEASACGSAQPRAGWTQRSGGATVLYNDVASDALLLRLNDSPPAGAFFSGFDPNPIATGAAVASVHHPQGDLKKVTEGRVLGFSHDPSVGGVNASFIEVAWSRGTTEGGSSGGGLWTANGSQFLFRGGLWGGSALCSNTEGADFYSRFDLAYPALAIHLAAQGGGGIDYTDLWWNPGESGWGLNLIQHPSRVIFGVWYTYDANGKRTWYVLPSGTWTSSNTYTGPLYATAGPSIAQSFDASKVHVMPVGTATLSFSSADRGTFSYSVGAVSGSKAIERQPF
ncbi:MAG TPA: trypsin-like peptidase domain-containing protein [Usitatibacter sp.]|nr:trypsin-like peptidase domain-containing protein [Usitatibacter sp.]